MIAGIGCRREATADAVIEAIDEALRHHGRARDQLGVVAVLPAKAGEAGVAEAAYRLGLPLRVVEAAEALETPSHSPASVAATGHGSASEAAALAAAGPGGHLLGPRIARGAVTCALAIGPET